MGPPGAGRAGFAAAWCELPAPASVRPWLGLLAERGVDLCLAWPTDGPPDARLALAAEAARRGVRVRPWPLLSRDDGYWAGAANADAFAAAALAVLDHWEGAGLAPGWLMVDVEPPYARAAALDEALRRRPPNVRRVIRLLRADTADLTRARRIYAALVADARRRGWRVALTTLPFVVDGEGLARALALPVDGVPWDRITLQVYRTMFDDLVPRPVGRGFGPGLVHAYARAARARFGDRAGLDLGLVGEGVWPASVYAGPADLGADLAAAHAAGIPPSHLHVYDLGGIIERGPSEQWFAAAGPARPPRDRAARCLRAALRLADRALCAAQRSTGRPASRHSSLPPS